MNEARRARQEVGRDEKKSEAWGVGGGCRVKGKAKRGGTLFASLKLKGSYTSFAVYESFNGASGFSIKSLNCEVDYAVPGQPQFKKTIP